MRLDDDDPLSEIITIAEAAEAVGRAPATVRDWIRTKDLKPLRVGRRTFTTKRDAREAERAIHERRRGKSADS